MNPGFFIYGSFGLFHQQELGSIGEPVGLHPDVIDTIGAVITSVVLTIPVQVELSSIFHALIEAAHELAFGIVDIDLHGALGIHAITNDCI